MVSEDNLELLTKESETMGRKVRGERIGRSG